MKYSDGYKYQLKEGKAFPTLIKPTRRLVTEFIILELSGLLIIKSGYAWDGPSGPTIDTPYFIVGSVAHDALYQLMRMDLLDHKRWREADYILRRIILSLLDASRGSDSYARKLSRAVWKIRMPIAMAGLKLAKGRAALPSHRKKIYEIL